VHVKYTKGTNLWYNKNTSPNICSRGGGNTLMNEYDEILKKLMDMGIYCWIEDGQVIYENISVGIQNEKLELLNNQKL
jgi:hypothetical protein